MAKVSSQMKKGENIKAIGKTVLNTEKVFVIIQMVLFTMVSSHADKGKDKVL